MSASDSGIYQGTIPASSVTERGVEYYIDAVDAAGNAGSLPATNPDTSPYEIRVAFSGLNCTYSTPANSYRMISIPGDLDSSTPSAVLEDDLGDHDRSEWRLLRGQSGSYVEYGVGSVQSMEPGRGYWLITRTAKSWDVGAGSSVSTSGGPGGPG